MKKTTLLIAAGVIVAIVAIGSSFMKGNQNSNDALEDWQITPYYRSGVGWYATTGEANPDIHIDRNMLLAPTIEEFVHEMDFLSEEEKQQLIQDDREAAIHYQEADKLSEQANAIADSIYEKHEDTFQKQQDLMNEHEDLWLKLSESATEEQLRIEDNREFIRSSKALTEEEKQTLLQQEDRLDEIDKEIEKIHDEIEQATMDLTKQIDECYQKADAIHAKSQSIWNKIYEQENISFPSDDNILLY